MSWETVQTFIKLNQKDIHTQNKNLWIKQSCPCGDQIHNTQYNAVDASDHLNHYPNSAASNRQIKYMVAYRYLLSNNLDSVNLDRCCFKLSSEIMQGYGRPFTINAVLHHVTK